MADGARQAPPWDAAFTVALLVFGVINVTQTVAQARRMGEALQVVYTTQGLGEYTSTDAASIAGWCIIGSNVLALVLAIGFAVPRIRARRPAFWVPLVCAAIAVVITFALIVGAIAADPAFVAYVRTNA